MITWGNQEPVLIHNHVSYFLSVVFLFWVNFSFNPFLLQGTDAVISSWCQFFVEAAEINFTEIYSTHTRCSEFVCTRADGRGKATQLSPPWWLGGAAGIRRTWHVLSRRPQLIRNLGSTRTWAPLRAADLTRATLTSDGHVTYRVQNGQKCFLPAMKRYLIFLFKKIRIRFACI